MSICLMLLLVVALLACSNRNAAFLSNELLSRDIKQIEVSFYSAGEVTRWSLSKEEIDQWKSWLGSFSSEHMTFEVGNAPGENEEGGEVYNFSINDGEATISYSMYGENDSYIHFEGEWYLVSNPTDPFEGRESPAYAEEEIKWDRIPMVMVEGTLYLDTGKQIPVEIHRSTVLGTIASEIDRTEIPSENGQSNFGSIGAEYAFYEEGIVIMINQEWQFFQKEKSKLSLDIVTELSQKGEELSWDDFEKYENIGIGSGLYILRYELDDKFYLLVGGGSIEEEPMYIRLIRKSNEEDYIDIRTDDVEGFISK